MKPASQLTLEEMRTDFIARRKGCLSLPIAGRVVWSLAAVASFFVPAGDANLALLLCYLLLFPIAPVVAKLRGEQIGGGAENPLLRLAALCRVMVFFLWAILAPLYVLAPAFFPLAIGVAFGIHWVVFSWTVGSNLGILHAALRTAAVLGAWLAFPNNRVGAVAIAVAAVYLISLWQLRGMYRTFLVGKKGPESISVSNG